MEGESVTREEIIKGLLSIHAVTANYKGDQVILHSMPMQKLTGILYGAAELLKAQEPRVMTLEEVKRIAPDDDVWIEYHELAGWIISAVTVREIYDDGMLCRLQCLRFNFDRYGCYGGDWMAWRCWTSRPTDEQREATSWNE